MCASGIQLNFGPQSSIEVPQTKQILFVNVFSQELLAKGAIELKIGLLGGGPLAGIEREGFQKN